MKSWRRWLYRQVESRFLDGCSNFNSLDVRRSCRTKRQAREVFAQHGIPHAQGKVFFWPWQAFAFVQQQGFPVVLKPNMGGYSRGSFFPISSYRELLSALLRVKLWWPTTVIERYLRGKNYRVVVTKDGVEIAMRRYPPFVIGDGQRTIEELIDQENQVRREMQLLPVIHEIPKDQRVRRFLGKQGLSLQSIPAMDQEVELYHRIALDPGGSLETVDVSSIPAENLRLFARILELFEAEILGIDVILEQGIDHPISGQEGIFLEVNSRPYLKMHGYPRWGEVPDMESLLAKLSTKEVQDSDLF